MCSTRQHRLNILGLGVSFVAHVTHWSRRLLFRVGHQPHELWPLPMRNSGYLSYLPLLGVAFASPSCQYSSRVRTRGGSTAGSGGSHRANVDHYHTARWRQRGCTRQHDGRICSRARWVEACGHASATPGNHSRLIPSAAARTMSGQWHLLLADRSERHGIRWLARGRNVSISGCRNDVVPDRVGVRSASRCLSRRVGAIVEWPMYANAAMSLYSSEDSGETWTLRSSSGDRMGRCCPAHQGRCT